MFGGAFGRAAHRLLPAITSTTGAYAAVGMGALAAGATAAPLTGVMMMFELTGNYQIVLPLLVACGAAAALVNGLLGGSIYSLSARRRGVHAHIEEPLRDLSVAQAFERTPSIAHGAGAAEVARALENDGHAALPVVDERGFVVGLLQRRAVAAEPGRTAGELARSESMVLLLPDDDLAQALHRLSESGTLEAVVVESPEEPRPLGILTRDGILDAWRRANS